MFDLWGELAMSRYSLAYLLCLVVLVGCLVLCGPQDQEIDQ